MALPGCEAKPSVYHRGLLRDCEVQLPGGGLIPLGLIAPGRRSIRNAWHRVLTGSNAVGDGAHGQAVRPAGAFLAIGMAPPSTAKAMAVTFFNVAFFKPPNVSRRLLITSGDTPRSGSVPANTPQMNPALTFPPRICRSHSEEFAGDPVTEDSRNRETVKKIHTRLRPATNFTRSRGSACRSRAAFIATAAPAFRGQHVESPR
jgi:hypothetical protein